MINISNGSIKFDLQDYKGNVFLIEIIKQNNVIFSHKMENTTKFELPFDELKFENVPLTGNFSVRLLNLYGDYADLLDETDLYLEPMERSYPRADYGHIVGTNYTPAFAVNQIHFFTCYTDYRPEIKKELECASKIGMNSLRIYLHNKPFEDDKISFMKNLEYLIEDCSQVNIKPLFIFFDDCWHGEEEIVYEFEPIDGMHNGRWAKCPLFSQRKLSCYPLFYNYITDIISKYRNDNRIFAWEIWNEPKNLGMPGKFDVEFTNDLMCNSYHWARMINPKQPIISCWSGNRWGDVDNVHNYCTIDSAQEYNGNVGCFVDVRRGTLVTEAGCRKWKDQAYGSPVDWISWLTKRKEKGFENPGVFLNWELMVGNSNCTWHWSSQLNDMRPPIPWCGFFFPDLTPVSYTEITAIRRYTGKPYNIIIFHGFDNAEEIATLEKKGSFEVISTGSCGELVSSDATESTLSFSSNISDNFILQVAVCISNEAKAAISLQSDDKASSITLTEKSLSCKSENHFLSCDIDSYDNIYQNIKIIRESGKLRVFLNDMSVQKIESDTGSEPLRLSLHAWGHVRFDDLSIISKDWEG